LAGKVFGHEGLIRARDRYASASGRVLKFVVTPYDGGSILRGNLQLRRGLWCYEIACLVFACFFEAEVLYSIAVFPEQRVRLILLYLPRPLLVIPFLWCYIRAGLWFGRKREAELFETIEKVLARPRAQLLPQAIRKVLPSTPTEVFIRPRHEAPER
jgi:hypothetical protein